MSSLESMQPTLHLVHTLSGDLVQLAALNGQRRKGGASRRWWDKLMMSFLIWFCIFPGVLLITVVAAPQAEKLVAAAHDQTLAELKMDQAREAEDPKSG